MHVNNYRRRFSWCKIGIIISIFLVAGLVVWSCSNYFTTKEYTATVTEKSIKNYNNSSKFLVFTKLKDGQTRVFEIQDSLFKLRFNSADCYANINTGKTYNFKVIGWRIPILSEYENIMDFKEPNSK